MSFPTTPEELASVIATQRQAVVVATDQITQLDGLIREQRVIKDRHEKIQMILEELQTSWSSLRPGKGGASFFFLDVELVERVVAREFLSDGTPICTSEEEWKEYYNSDECYRERTGNLYFLFKYTRVPYFYPVVSIADVGRRECKGCKQPQPVVEYYCQTYDSPEGDEWTRKHYIFCLTCQALEVIPRECTPY